eukprot:3600369-Pyramimonas_sp.AAC.1
MLDSSATGACSAGPARRFCLLISRAHLEPPSLPTRPCLGRVSHGGGAPRCRAVARWCASRRCESAPPAAR